MHKRQKWGMAVMLFGVLLILGAAALVGWNWWESHRAAQFSATVADELTAYLNSPEALAQAVTTQMTVAQPAETETTSAEVSAPETAAAAEPDEPDTLEESAWEHYVHHRNLFEDWISIDGNWYNGILTIPKLDLRLPILGEYVYDDLCYTPSRYRGSYLTDDMILAGHNYDAHFGRLHLLEAGDLVEFTDCNGTVYTYAVTWVEELPDYALEDLVTMEGDWDLTLFTCTLSGASRVTVRCQRVEE